MAQRRKTKLLVLAFAMSVSLSVHPVLVQPASAGFFELLFGPQRPVQANAYAPAQVPQQVPSSVQGLPQPGASAAAKAQISQPSGAYCVRRCDGHFFPVSNTDRDKAGALCNSLCPAAQTEIFYGSGIDNARNARGQSYADSPNAFAYRERIVEKCTCNGKTPFGLAAIDYRKDPLLKSGDLVATNAGFVRTSSSRRGQASFTPVKEAWLSNGIKLTSQHIAQAPQPVAKPDVLAIRVHPAPRIHSTEPMPEQATASIEKSNSGTTSLATTNLATTNLATTTTASLDQNVRLINTTRILSTE